MSQPNTGLAANDLSGRSEVDPRDRDYPKDSDEQLEWEEFCKSKADPHDQAWGDE